jgi:hypothetical protein
LQPCGTSTTPCQSPNHLTLITPIPPLFNPKGCPIYQTSVLEKYIGHQKEATAPQSEKDRLGREIDEMVYEVMDFVHLSAFAMAQGEENSGKYSGIYHRATQPPSSARSSQNLPCFDYGSAHRLTSFHAGSPLEKDIITAKFLVWVNHRIRT